MTNIQPKSPFFTTEPFTVHTNDGQTVSISTKKKILTVAASIFIGLFTFGVGGIVAFFGISKALRDRKIEKLSSQQTPVSRLPTAPLSQTTTQSTSPSNPSEAPPKTIKKPQIIESQSKVKKIKTPSKNGPVLPTRQRELTPEEQEIKRNIETTSPYKEIVENKAQWFQDTHIMEYFAYLGGQYPHVSVPKPSDNMGIPFVDNIERWVMKDRDRNPNKDASAFCLNLGNSHWTFVYIDHKKKTVEYYNSFGNDHSARESLQKIAAQLNYRYINKVTTSLQNDAYQCGPWTCYFFENRVKNPDIDFNKMKNPSAEIANYRKTTVEKIIKNQAICTAAIKREKQSFIDYFGPSEFEFGNVSPYKKALLKDAENDDQYDVRRMKNLLEGKLLDPEDFAYLR